MPKSREIGSSSGLITTRSKSIRKKPVHRMPSTGGGRRGSDIVCSPRSGAPGHRGADQQVLDGPRAAPGHADADPAVAVVVDHPQAVQPLLLEPDPGPAGTQADL